MAKITHLLVLLLAVAASAAEADTIYKWVDSSGVTHYGEAPPSQSSYKKLDPNTAKTGAVMGDGDGYFEKTDKQRAATQAADDSAKAAQAQKAERCAKARERMTFLDQHPAHRLMTTGDDGQPSRVTSDQYDEMMNKAKTEEATDCS